MRTDVVLATATLFGQLLIPPHQPTSEPTPTRVVQIGGATCPAGTLLVATSAAKAIDGVVIDSIHIDGKSPPTEQIVPVRNRLRAFTGLRAVEIGCFSDRDFIVNILGAEPKDASARISFRIWQGGVELFP